MSLNSQGFETGTDYTRIPADRHWRQWAIVFASITTSVVTLLQALADLYKLGDYFTEAVKYIACFFAVVNIGVVALSLTFKDKLATVVDETRSPLR